MNEKGPRVGRTSFEQHKAAEDEAARLLGSDTEPAQQKDKPVTDVGNIEDEELVRLAEARDAIDSFDDGVVSQERRVTDVLNEVDQADVNRWELEKIIEMYTVLLAEHDKLSSAIEQETDSQKKDRLYQERNEIAAANEKLLRARDKKNMEEGVIEQKEEVPDFENLDEGLAFVEKKRADIKTVQKHPDKYYQGKAGKKQVIKKFKREVALALQQLEKQFNYTESWRKKLKTMFSR